MSTILTTPPPARIPTFPVQRISVAKYHQMIQAGVYTEDDKVELIEGYIVPKMSQIPPHGGTVQNVEKKILRQLPAEWATRCQAPITLTDSEPEPDVVAVRGNEATYFMRHPNAADIGLTVEVSESTLGSGRGEKKRIYARANISITGSSTSSIMSLKSTPNLPAQPLRPPTRPGRISPPATRFRWC